MLRIGRLVRFEDWMQPLTWGLLAVIAADTLRTALGGDIGWLWPDGVLLLAGGCVLTTMRQSPRLSFAAGLLGLATATVVLGPRLAFVQQALLPPQDPASTLRVTVALACAAFAVAGLLAFPTLRRQVIQSAQLLLLYVGVGALILAALALAVSNAGVHTIGLAGLSLIVLGLLRIGLVHARTGLVALRYPRLWLDLAAALALVVLFGWFLQVGALVRGGTQSVPIQFNTALSLLFLALALRHAGETPKMFSLLVLVLPVVIAVSATLEELGLTQRTLSQLFWIHRIEPQPVTPGRMAFSSAMTVLLLSASVVMRESARGRPMLRLLEWGCGLLVLVIGTLTLLGHATGRLEAGTWTGHTPMALLTAINVSLLGLAVMLRGVDRGGDWAGRAIVLPALVTLAVGIVTSRVWLLRDTLPVTAGMPVRDDFGFLVAGIFIAGLLGVALRFGLIARAGARMQERLATELKQRNDILEALAAGESRVDVLRSVLDGMCTRFETADISLFYQDDHGHHLLGSDLARRLQPLLFPDPPPASPARNPLELPSLAETLGYTACRLEPIRGVDSTERGQFLILTRPGTRIDPHDEAYIRASAHVAGVALQRDDVMRQMEQSKECYQSLVDNHPDAVLQLDGQGTIEAVNTAALQLFDRAGENLIGVPLASLLDPASAAVLSARMQSALNGKAVSLDAVVALPQPRTRELDLILVPLRAQAGASGLFAIGRDVSRYRAADRALRRTYERSLEFRDRLLELNQVAVALPSHTEVADLLQHLAQSMLSSFQVEGVRITLDPEHEPDAPLVVCAYAGASWNLPPAESTHAVARAHHTPLRQTSADLAARNPASPDTREVGSVRNWLGMALVLDRAEPIGSVELANLINGEFDDDDESLLVQFAQMAVTAVQRTRLLKNLSDTQSIAARQLAFTRAMAGSIVDGLYAIDQAGRLNFMNPSAERLLGCDAEARMGQLFEQTGGLVASGGQGPGTQALVSGAVVREENRTMRNEAGQSLPVDLLASPMKLAGETIGAVVVFRDISERLRADEARTERDRFFELSLELFVITDSTGYFMQTNTAVTRLLGLAPTDLARHTWLEFVHTDDRAASEAVVEQLILTGRLEGFVNRWIGVNGEVHWLEWAAALAPDKRIFAVARDVTERHHHESEMAHFSTHDSLTGLPRIEQVEAFLMSALAAAAQRGGHLSVFYIDIDRFHAINDSRGRLVGDAVLRIVAQRLSATVGERGKLCRVAGDEFVLVQVNVGDGPDSQEVGEAMRVLIEEPIAIEQGQVFLTCSVGVSSFPENGATANELVRQAEAAMIRAKDEGRNAVATFSNDEAQALRDRLELGSGLRNAIGAEELVLYFQPQISAHNWQVNGVEALVRWQHPQHGLLLPGRFIAVAEELGVIVELGQWVLNSACRRAREWLDSGLADFTVAVNVSSLQLQRPDFLERVQHALEVSRLPPRYLELELTESMVMAHVERVISTMRSLKALGVSISLDDFGSGYSSLSYLRRFSIDKLKIDESFVRDITTDPGSAGICRAIIGLGHQLGMTVSAEGVETIGQASFLRRSECDQFQGKYFSVPLPVEQAFNVLRRRYLRQEELGGTLHEAKAANTLLLLDDEENVIRALVRLLRRDGYTIVTATQADQAFELLASQPVQVIISDQRMPDISGTDFLYKVKELYPDTVRLILSGYSDFASLTDAINRGAVYRFVAKPWDDEELRRTVREAFRMVDSRQGPRVV